MKLSYIFLLFCAIYPCNTYLIPKYKIPFKELALDSITADYLTEKLHKPRHLIGGRSCSSMASLQQHTQCNSTSGVWRG